MAKTESTSSTSVEATSTINTNTVFKDLIDAQTKLLRDPPLHDLVIQCGDKTWKCQQAVLCQRCNFFKAACGSGFKEAKTRSIQLGDDDPVELDSMLLYLYTLAPPAFNDFDKASVAYMLGDKYDLPPFKNAAKAGMRAVARGELPQWHILKDESKKDMWISRVIMMWNITTTDSTEIKAAVIQALINSSRYIIQHDKVKTFMSEGNGFHLALTQALADELWNAKKTKW